MGRIWDITASLFFSLLVFFLGCPRWCCYATDVEYNNNLSLAINRTCSSYVIFDWGEHRPPSLPNDFRCSASYHTLDAEKVQVIESLHLTYGVAFSISALKNGTTYTFSLVCWAGTKTFRSAEMKFTTEYDRWCRATDAKYDNHLSLSINKTCSTYVIFNWSKHRPPSLPKEFVCDVTYHTVDADKAHVIERFYLKYGVPFSISALKNGTTYMYSMVCWAGEKKFRSAVIMFKTGPHCNDSHLQLEEIHSSKTTFSPVYYKDHKVMMSSAVEIAASTVLGLVGLIMLIVCAVYLWKKYQQRQTRIFMLSNTGPYRYERMHI